MTTRFERIEGAEVVGKAGIYSSNQRTLDLDRVAKWLKSLRRGALASGGMSFGYERWKDDRNATGIVTLNGTSDHR